MSEKAKFSDAAYAFDSQRSDFEESLGELVDFERIGWDHYDNSIEIYEVPPDTRLSEVAQDFLREAGFGIAYVNHSDGWETHYSKLQNGPTKGWRRRWVSDKSATTDRQAGGGDPGYYEISEWPATWGETTKDWLNNGYMRVVGSPPTPSDEKRW